MDEKNQNIYDIVTKKPSYISFCANNKESASSDDYSQPPNVKILKNLVIASSER